MVILKRKNKFNVLTQTLKQYIKYILVSFFTALSFVSFSQTTATVFGKITDSDNQPVEDVSVSIFGSALAPVFTNSKGEFRYEIPANADVVIVFNNINFKQSQKTVRLAPGEKACRHRAARESGARR